MMNLIVTHKKLIANCCFPEMSYASKTQQYVWSKTLCIARLPIHKFISEELDK